MRFDRRFAIAIAISLTWGTVVASGFYVLAGRWRGRPHAFPLKQVVVASRLLPGGSTIDRDTVVLQGVPEALVPPGTFSRLEDVAGRPITRDIQAGEPVVEARLAARGSGAGLGPLIPPGMRAISVRVNDVVGVAGFVLPGMRVDVLVTGKPPNGIDSQTRTVLQNITVLSAGQTIQNDPKSQPIVAPVVTLLVTPGEAEALTLANSEGHIQLVLRNSTDQAIEVTTGRSLHELYQSGVAPATVLRSRPVVVDYGRKPALAAGATRPSMSSETPKASTVSPPQPEPERMILIQGTVKKVEVFPPEPKVNDSHEL